MMLTAATVCAMYMLYRWHEQNMRDTASAIIAVVMMGAATLTKGPVGTLIPCMVMGVFMLMRGTGFFKTVLWLTLFALLSLVPYALWFYAAWLQGGQEFLDLVYAENIGRMVNAMGYEPHVQLWPYYLKTLLVGLQPWTLLLFVSLFFIRFSLSDMKPAHWWHDIKEWLRKGDAVDVFSLTSIVIIFVFYCIPQTKKPGYLLPIYPFLAYFLAKYILWMAENRRKVMCIYGGVLSVLILLSFAVFIIIRLGLVPDSVFTGSSAQFYIDTMHTLQNVGPWWQWTILVFYALFGLYWWIRHKDDDMHNIYAVLFMTFGLWVAVDAVYRPAILNSRSVRTTSIRINHAVPASAGPLYEFIERGVTEKGDYVHFFEVNFYLRNRIKNFDRQKPKRGFLLITKTDAERNLPLFKRQGYHFLLYYEADRREMQVYRFHRD
jgi:4-amino-4-deoxy-L-arabinose transferase-like glycosyltransferase